MALLDVQFRVLIKDELADIDPSYEGFPYLRERLAGGVAVVQSRKLLDAIAGWEEWEDLPVVWEAQI